MSKYQAWDQLAPPHKGFFLLQRYSVKHRDDNRAVLTFNLDRHFDLDVG